MAAEAATAFFSILGTRYSVLGSIGASSTEVPSTEYRVPSASTETMERLWSPWRLAYVTGTDKPDTGCIFCSALERAVAEPLVLHIGETCFVLLNLYPYNNGHLMVVPRRHIGTLAAATPAELAELMLLVQRAELALTEAYAPHGMNMGINLGRPAGAGVLDHLHMHVVPRWNGDTNFMSVVGNVRVLPEELPQVSAKLRPIFERLARHG